ncbi:hypothetical protein evm_001910 [Chilo suppressalis]|nr:hypothetical protein evm_001910 [Chilo suppressalis]
MVKTIYVTMWIGVFATWTALLVLAFGNTQPLLNFGDRVVPSYIKNALKVKDNVKPLHREKNRTFQNLSLKQVFDKVKLITRELNQHAKKNGYKVDYKLRVF